MLSRTRPRSSRPPLKVRIDSYSLIVSGATYLKTVRAILCVRVPWVSGTFHVSVKTHPPRSITEHEKKPQVPSVVYGLKTLQCGIGWLCLRRIVLLKPEGMIKQTNKKILIAYFIAKMRHEQVQ